MKKKLLSFEDTALFCKQLGMLVGSGVTVSESVTIISQNTRRLRDVCALLAAQLQRGSSLSEALADSQVFSHYTVRLVAVGETSGRLDAVLESLYRFYEREQRLRDDAVSAVVYPLAMIFVMLAVIVVLLTQALPIFSQVFEQIGISMPEYLRAAQNGGGILLVAYILLGALAVCAAAYLILRAGAAGRRLLTRTFEESYFTRRLASATNSSRFIYALSMLISSGVNTDDAVELLTQLLDSPGMQTKAAKLRELVLQGRPLAAALAECGMLSGEYVSMLAVGERAGRLDEMLDTVAGHLSDDADERVSRLLAAIEPTIVVIMSLIVGGVLLSIMLPIMQVMSAL